MVPASSGNFINDTTIYQHLSLAKSASHEQVIDILSKAKSLSGLNLSDVATLTNISDPELLHLLFSTAKEVKNKIYGNRLVIFAPLYISNLCANECTYCAFRSKNTAVHRKSLNQAEIAEETKLIIDQGHKRVLLVAGESYRHEGLSYIYKSIETVYGVKSGQSGEIRRINVNLAPLSVEEFAELQKTNIGTFQLFQETYHRDTYKRVHLAGKKADYDWRVTAIDRAFTAGITDCGIGVLFGLTDWRFEILALMQHINHLENNFNIGPHTISVPRLEPALGSDLASHPPQPVSDIDFRKIVAILRLAVPYTGIIMSTRETPNLRRETFALGVSQISAGSRTNPGGYSESEEEDVGSQFSLGDHRSLEEVIQDVATLGYIPSFCTGCYRLGRTGEDFMDLAKPGQIRSHCDPNAVTTFLEYLLDYAGPATREIGEKLISSTVDQFPQNIRQHTLQMLDLIRSGKRDIYC